MAIFRRSYRETDDERLMKYAVRGDERAFEELYDRYATRIHGYFFKMLWKDREMAEDFTQELFVKVVAKGSGFDGSRTFKTWLFSVAHNMCKNAYRHHEVKSRAAEHLKTETVTAETMNTSARIDHADFRAALDQALNELDEAKRSTFLLRFDEEQSIKEISEALECSEGTVKSRIFYTLKHLNTRLQGYAHLIKDNEQ